MAHDPWEDIADAVAFLASDDARWITGSSPRGRRFAGPATGVA
ncbi:hypothetical protein [Streptomyces sp. NPDC053427]